MLWQIVFRIIDIQTQEIKGPPTCETKRDRQDILISQRHEPVTRHLSRLSRLLFTPWGEVIIDGNSLLPSLFLITDVEEKYQEIV
ncbi:MAG: hypothetical protein COZ70_01960 [Deltaproteobacteria bacterium CG_4_8_14_3_um_filter_51_11]|nr:MAG: hypothetical protein COZ70_01960 [Deltaproteobacteria bacterium CG_4_8_14_3_um_filter_51_11]PIY22295.1 MAG: hypothetical protein COZ11_13315 [Deltaproteobacteria bacterium CG_4_10_14_3_um_filter_51_14]PJB37008.1 MAG: hypothetical protein CO107_06120 [Deltaproteobacteria bacterium CG_4_9_14_3_um_filter_51_14]